MTPEQVRLVQASAARTAPAMRTVAHDVYARLFAADPALRAMFPTSTDELEHKLAASVAALVAAVADFDAFTAQTQRLGALHRGLRVTSAHYAALGEALLAALAAADLAWDDGTAEAWADLYDLMAESMLLAGRAARAGR